MIDVLKKKLGRRKLAQWSHPDQKACCIIELVNETKWNIHSDSPSLARMPDFRLLNDSSFWKDDRERKRWMLKLAAVYYDWENQPQEEIARKIEYSEFINNPAEHIQKWISRELHENEPSTVTKGLIDGNLSVTREIGCGEE